jgi:Fe2+ transport system protein FeoA
MDRSTTNDGGYRPLTEVPVGSQARVATLDGLPIDQCERLQAYGLAPGHWLSVVQHSPVTVVQVEQTELAFEAEIACHVKMEW